MREAAFVKQNVSRWQDYEKELAQANKLSADRLASLYVQLTDDLAYARTHFPKTVTVNYLNGLASQVHRGIYRNKREEGNRFVTFWKQELPLLFASVQREFLYALLIFSASMLVGLLSALNDDTFVRLILGDGYVNMTLQNIKEGTPMAVYDQGNGMGMFFRITYNNIMVSFFAFAAGVFFSIGTGYILFKNGVMLGAFMGMFYREGVLDHAISVWIHGTLEISVIIIAGGAGLVMGNSFLFPGALPRGESFKRGVMKGLKVVVGLVPIFILAGFLESFITRQTQYPLFVKLIIIGLSATFIIWYFVVLPNLVKRKHKLHEHNH